MPSIAIVAQGSLGLPRWCFRRAGLASTAVRGVRVLGASTRNTGRQTRAYSDGNYGHEGGVGRPERCVVPGVHTRQTPSPLPALEQARRHRTQVVYVQHSRQRRQHPRSRQQPEHEHGSHRSPLEYAPPPPGGFGGIERLVASSRAGNCGLTMACGYGEPLTAAASSPSEAVVPTASDRPPSGGARVSAQPGAQPPDPWRAFAPGRAAPRGASPHCKRRPRTKLMIPTAPPFVLLVTTGAALPPQDRVVAALREHSPVEIVQTGGRHMYVFFASRADLSAALTLYGTVVDGDKLLLSTTDRFHKLAAVGENGPFVAYLYGLPKARPATAAYLMQVFRSVSPVACQVRNSAQNGDAIAFLHFARRDDLLRACDLSHADEVERIGVRPR